jgi:carbonic anhydrase/acetyltransferase-like protein (isoleucine patch superfamily)
MILLAGTGELHTRILSDLGDKIGQKGYSATLNDQVDGYTLAYYDRGNWNGKPYRRIADADKYDKLGLKPVTLINKVYYNDANIFHRLELGDGSIVLGYNNVGWVNSGKHCIFDRRCYVAHKTRMGDHCYIGMGVSIGNSVNMGNNCCFLRNSSANDGVEVCDNVLVLPDTVVVFNITLPGIYCGVPARRKVCLTEHWS